VVRIEEIGTLGRKMKGGEEKKKRERKRMSGKKKSRTGERAKQIKISTELKREV
jgi:hypothetical protein